MNHLRALFAAPASLTMQATGTGVTDATPDKVVDQVADVVNQEVDHATNVLSSIFKPLQAAIPDLIFAGLVLIFGLIIIKFLLKLAGHALSRSRLDGIMAGFLKSLIKIVLHVLLFIIVMSMLHVPMTSIITVLGSAGVAVGLALKDSLSNLAGGFIVLFSKPLKEGDTVQVEGCTGKVESISILYTKIITPDNTTVYIPNGTVSSSKIINYTDKELRRVDFAFGIGYENDIEQARQVILHTVSSHPLVLSDPAPEVHVNAHLDSAVELKAWVWVKSEHYWPVYYAVMEQVKLAFDQHGISIPYPQLDVHHLDASSDR